jgi:hypothetical protein
MVEYVVSLRVDIKSLAFLSAQQRFVNYFFARRSWYYHHNGAEPGLREQRHSYENQSSRSIPTLTFFF